MMHRRIALLVLLFLVFSLLPITGTPLATYEPYEENEFPLWTYKLRRGEILFFGSLVITMAVSSLAYNVAVSSNMISEASTPLNALLIQGGIASVLSLGISVADYIIGEVQAK
ncbi:MAG: hypothetical protein WC136_01970 [Sphaerochaeta sp.]|nr:hypothetical protein [Sphaerochaeta sp.]